MLKNFFQLKSLKTFQCIYNELERKSSLPLIRPKRQLSPLKTITMNTDEKILREKTNNHRRHLTRAKSVRSRSKSSNRIKSNEPLKTS